MEITDDIFVVKSSHMMCKDQRLGQWLLKHVGKLPDQGDSSLRSYSLQLQFCVSSSTLNLCKIVFLHETHKTVAIQRNRGQMWEDFELSLDVHGASAPSNQNTRY